MPILLRALLPVRPKFTGESARAYEALRQTNADTLPTSFNPILAPLQPVAQEGTEMDCAEAKHAFVFPFCQPGSRIMLSMQPGKE